MQALVGGGRARVEVPAVELERLGAKLADAVEQQPRAMRRGELPQPCDVVKTPGGGFVMDHGEVTEAVAAHRLLDGDQIDGLAPPTGEALVIDAVSAGHARHAFAVDAVLDDQHPAAGRYHAREHRFHRGGAGSGEQHRGPIRWVEGVDVDELAAQAVLQCRKLGLAMTQVGARHRLANAPRQRHGTGIEQYRPQGAPPIWAISRSSAAGGASAGRGRSLRVPVRIFMCAKRAPPRNRARKNACSSVVASVRSTWR